jgi:prepilin-type N-terminal cleavage/methylation domain-containing protein
MTRAGFTLVELIAVLAILGVAATVTGIAVIKARPVSQVDEVAGAIARVRSQSVRVRRPVSITVLLNERMQLLTAMPDGRVVADQPIGGYRLARSRCEADRESVCSKSLRP